MKIFIKIQGISPLLMCKCSNETLNGSNRLSKNATPREEAELFAYRLKDNELYIPVECIFASIIGAGKFHKIGKNKITTQKSSLVPAGITIINDACRLGTKDYEVDSRPVTIPSTGGKIIRHRPRLDKWETEFELCVDSGMFSENLVRQLIDDAGLKCGVLSFRPTCKGSFGKFKVIAWKAEKS